MRSPPPWDAEDRMFTGDQKAAYLFLNRISSSEHDTDDTEGVYWTGPTVNFFNM